MAVDTLFLCFLEVNLIHHFHSYFAEIGFAIAFYHQDLERNDGSAERPYSMSISLQKILGRMNRIASESRRHSNYH